MTTKRMSEEEIDATLAMLNTGHCKEGYGCNALTVCACATMEDAAEAITQLRAELTAARTVEGAEVAEMIARLRGINFSSNPDDYDRATQDAADLLTRLSAAKAEAERERDEARAALAQAREAALEQAARACETLTGSDATPTLRPGARMCLHRIRALKSTPTQESETP